MLLLMNLIIHYESGHGKSAAFIGLEVWHAKLDVGSSITFVNSLMDTYELQKKS